VCERVLFLLFSRREGESLKCASRLLFPCDWREKEEKKRTRRKRERSQRGKKGPRGWLAKGWREENGGRSFYAARPLPLNLRESRRGKLDFFAAKRKLLCVPFLALLKYQRFGYNVCFTSLPNWDRSRGRKSDEIALERWEGVAQDFPDARFFALRWRHPHSPSVRREKKANPPRQLSPEAITTQLARSHRQLREEIKRRRALAEHDAQGGNKMASGEKNENENENESNEEKELPKKTKKRTSDRIAVIAGHDEVLRV